MRVNNDVTVWRYLSLSKFIDLLRTKKLYFCRGDLFQDIHEGATPRFDYQMRQRIASYMKEKGLTNAPIRIYYNNE